MMLFLSAELGCGTIKIHHNNIQTHAESLQAALSPQFQRQFPKGGSNLVKPERRPRSEEDLRSAFGVERGYARLRFIPPLLRKPTSSPLLVQAGSGLMCRAQHSGKMRCKAFYLGSTHVFIKHTNGTKNTSKQINSMCDRSVRWLEKTEKIMNLLTVISSLVFCPCFSLYVYLC